MKSPVLIVGPRAMARLVAAALQNDFSVTVEEDPARARALAAVGSHLAVVTVGETKIDGALELEATAPASLLIAEVTAALARASKALKAHASVDAVGALRYDDYLEQFRYAITRRYLASVLHRHHGSVTDAARAAGLKRESLHRLLRRHHLVAEDFRTRD